MGYENNLQANADAFAHGWFHTGDQGTMDAEGCIRITGRLKEIINRGGEKIAPGEVEDVLTAHPAVLEAIVFAVPHVRLGEDVAAAVVLRQPLMVTAEELRRSAMTHLAAFKVPIQVLIVDDIPTGPSGKPQRHLLAEQLGLLPSARGDGDTSVDRSGPRTPLEEILIGIWGQVLGVDGLGIHDNFFQLGGDSILATQLLWRVSQTTQVECSLPSFIASPRLEQGLS